MTNLPTLTLYGGVVPNRATQDDNTRALAVFSFLEYAGGSLVADINTNFVSKLNTLSSEINTAATTVANDKNIVVEAKNITLAAKDAVLGAASLLEDGAINDSTITLLDTWSSFEINAKLSLKADKSELFKLAEAHATALSF